MVSELNDFLAHERGHRARFGAELIRRNRARCRTYFWCGLGGLALGVATGLAGRRAIAATTVAIERVVLRHMREQIEALQFVDAQATETLRWIVAEEQQHHDLSAERLATARFWPTLINPVVSASTEAVIWLGMRL